MITYIILGVLVNLLWYFLRYKIQGEFNFDFEDMLLLYIFTVLWPLILLAFILVYSDAISIRKGKLKIKSFKEIKRETEGFAGIANDKMFG